MQLFCLQPDVAWQDKPANHERIRSLLSAARPPAGSLVVLPEMFATGFSMDVEAIAEPLDGPTHAFLAAAARDAEVFLLGGVVTRGPDGRGRNEAVLYSPSGVETSRYRKLHPFTLGGEHAGYTRGEKVATFNWQGATVAPFICYDLRFPEAFRHAVRNGAQVYTVLSNWPAKREAHWLALLRARAIENQAYVAGVNRVGSDPHLEYAGRSLIIDPGGEILADAGNQEGFISAEIDLMAQQEYRRKFPVLADMRSEFFASDDASIG